MTTGITITHARSCASRAGAKCSCRKPMPTYAAWAWSARDGRKIKKSFSSLAAAKSWRADAISALRKGTMKAPSRETLRGAAQAWLDGTQAGTIRTRSGDRYKPSALRGDEKALRDRILPELGGLRLSDIHRRDVQLLADRMLADGCDPSTIRNAIVPLRVIFRRALEDGEVLVNPTSFLRLPAVEGRRDRAADPAEAARLLAALSVEDRPLWATAFYAGLRRGELLALRWDDIDLASGVIQVRRAWDSKEGLISPKSTKGTRTVPIPALLRDYLDEHILRTRREDEALVFGSTATRPFTPSAVRRRAATAWRKANEAEAEHAAAEGRKADLLVPIGLHECRHTYVSIMHEAGLSLERIGDYVGHSSTYMTDRYRHLMRGHEAEAAKLLDAFLARSDTAARLAQVDSST